MHKEILYRLGASCWGLTLGAALSLACSSSSDDPSGGGGTGNGVSADRQDAQNDDTETGGAHSGGHGGRVEGQDSRGVADDGGGGGLGGTDTGEGGSGGVDRASGGTPSSGVVLSVNFGSSEVGGIVPIPRSDDFVAGMVKAAWWNNIFVDPGLWRATAQNSVPFVLSDGTELDPNSNQPLEARVTTPNNDNTKAVFASSQTIGHTASSRDLRLHTDSYVSLVGTNMVGFEARHLPAQFARGWSLYIATHFSFWGAWGHYRFDLDLGMDGSIDRTVFSNHHPPGDWTEDTQFSNASQSDTQAGIGSEHSNYVVIEGVDAGHTSFSLTVTNIDTDSGTRAGFNAIQVVATQ